jgi:hypothetical protein
MSETNEKAVNVRQSQRTDGEVTVDEKRSNMSIDGDESEQEGEIGDLHHGWRC